MRSNRGSSLTPDQEKIVEMAVDHYRKELMASLPEITVGIQNSGSGGSFSSTLQIKPGRGDRFIATLDARVRIPRVPVVIEMHMTDDGQLSLGLPPMSDDGE